MSYLIRPARLQADLSLVKTKNKGHFFAAVQVSLLFSGTIKKKKNEFNRH